MSGALPRFLQGPGEMAARMRAFDWSASPLGPPESWPQALKTLAGLMLASRQPMFIAWGRESQAWLYNDAFVPIMGEKHPRMLGAHALDGVWSEAREALAPLFARVFAGEPVHMEDFSLMLDRHGRLEEAHFSFSYTPVADDAGTVSGLFGACIEITDSVVARRREREAIERERRRFEQAPGFMCVLAGPDHVLEFVNEAHRELFNSAAWIGKPIRDAFPDLAGQGYFERLDEVYRTGTRYIAEASPVRFSRFPGQPVEERLLTFIYEPVTDEAGHVSGIFCVGHDVTAAEAAQVALRESEARLREADRRKDEFISTLAHELRNPLAPLRNALHLLQTVHDPDILERLRTMMRRQVEQMTRLVDDLLDIARITHGKIVLRREPVDIASIISSALETCAPALEKASIRITVALPPPPGALVDGDALRLTQVISNLVNNAVKFSERGGVIEITAAADADGSVVVEVRDHGAGIPPDKLEEVFEMFSQLEGSLDRTRGGLGLGLPLARRIVELHGGTVVAHSAGPGQGAVFVVRLPAARGDRPAAAARRQDASQPGAPVSSA